MARRSPSHAAGRPLASRHRRSPLDERQIAARITGRATMAIGGVANELISAGQQVRLEQHRVCRHIGSKTNWRVLQILAACAGKHVANVVQQRGPAIRVVLAKTPAVINRQPFPWGERRILRRAGSAERKPRGGQRKRRGRLEQTTAGSCNEVVHIRSRLRENQAGTVARSARQ